MDMRTQREMLHTLQQSMDGAQSSSLEKHANPLEGSQFQEQTRVLTSTTLESSSQGQGPSVQDSIARPGQDTEAISMCVDIPVAKASAVGMGGFPDNNQDVELCPSLTKFAAGISLPPSEANASYPVAEDTFAYSNEPVDITTDSDSEDPLQDVAHGDADPESD